MPQNCEIDQLPQLGHRALFVSSIIEFFFCLYQFFECTHFSIYLTLETCEIYILPSLEFRDYVFTLVIIILDFLSVSRHRTLMNVFDKVPIVDKTAFVAPNASMIGDVHVGEGSSIWYGCILRGETLLQFFRDLFAH